MFRRITSTAILEVVFTKTSFDNFKITAPEGIVTLVAF
jgi:hypothetical protein